VERGLEQGVDALAMDYEYPQPRSTVEKKGRRRVLVVRLKNEKVFASVNISPPEKRVVPEKPPLSS
jgi:hypothetical protein